MSIQYTPFIVPMKVQENVMTLPLGVETQIVVEPPDIPVYDGSYDVTPLPGAEVVLETVGMRMEDDVTVREIPYYETTNESGGYTVIIG